jgi:hypothetical protein
MTEGFSGGSPEWGQEFAVGAEGVPHAHIDLMPMTADAERVVRGTLARLDSAIAEQGEEAPLADLPLITEEDLAAVATEQQGSQTRSWGEALATTAQVVSLIGGISGAVVTAAQAKEALVEMFGRKDEEGAETPAESSLPPERKKHLDAQYRRLSFSEEEEEEPEV